MSNLDRAYWESLREKYPEKVWYFLRWVEMSFTEYERLSALTVDDFYQMPLSFQLGFFYEFICEHNRDREVVAKEVWEAAIEQHFAGG